MKTEHDHVKPCTTLGHLYSSLLVTRCPHLEAYTVTLSIWRDTDRDEPMVIHQEDIEFGPFDSLVHIENTVLRRTLFCIGQLALIPASG